MAAIIGGGPARNSLATSNMEKRKKARLTAHENLDIVVGWRHVIFNLILGNETRATSPTLRGIVEHIVDLETVGVGSSESVKLLLKKDILEVNIGIDEAEFRCVFWVLQGSMDDLQHGCNTRTARNHTNLARES